MRHEIAAYAEGSDHLDGVRIGALTAKEALQRADGMARRGMREIKITSPDGRRYGNGEFRAAAGLYLSPLPKSLDPAAIQIAVSAYETVLQSLNGTAQHNSSRERVARYILRRMFFGERNPLLLRDGAMSEAGISENIVGVPRAARINTLNF